MLLVMGIYVLRDLLKVKGILKYVYILYAYSSNLLDQSPFILEVWDTTQIDSVNNTKQREWCLS